MFTIHRRIQEEKNRDALKLQPPYIGKIAYLFQQDQIFCAQAKKVVSFKRN